MSKDQRLDLGRYVSNPFNKGGIKQRRLDFNELFRAKPDSGQYPWNPSRFNQEDLLRKMQTRKRTLNPRLDFVPNTPFFDDNTEVTPEYDMFGLGRFDRPNDYDFFEGRAKTMQRPQEQPDFNPKWVEAYKLSPTVNPGKTAKNPMPRIKNPDPNGYLMSMAERRAENEVEDNPSVAQLLERKGTVVKEQEQATGETVSEVNATEEDIVQGEE